MNLQLFATPVQGKQLVYLYRVLKDAATKPASLLAFTTENNRKVDKDADSKATKDGSIRTPGASKQEIECKTILAKGSTDYDDLEDAMLSDEIIELWEINRMEKGSDGKYKAKYFQGYLTSLEIDSASDDFVTVDLTFGLNGTGKAGQATLSADQEATADYVFTDTLKTAK